MLGWILRGTAFDKRLKILERKLEVLKRDHLILTVEHEELMFLVSRIKSDDSNDAPK